MNAAARPQARAAAVPDVELRGLAHRYADGTEALRGLDGSVAPGEALAIVGANGAGKSTLLLHLAGLLLPTAGAVRIAGQTLEAATRAAVQATVGYVFQDSDDQLFMPTVEEDVAFGPLNLGLTPAQARERVAQALGRVGAGHLARRATYRLSGGEKRLAALAGVLAMQPRLLVLDEPSAGLDPAARRQLIGLLRGLEPTRIVATHDLDLVLDTCPRVWVLDQGRCVADGAPAELFRDAALLQRCRLEPPLRWQGPGDASP